MSKVIAREFIHGIHIPERLDDNKKIMNKDTIVIKEKLHYDNGNIIDNLNVITEFKRDFYITKEIYKNHKQKKQWEELSKLTKFSATQSNLPKEILKKLGQQKFGKVTYRDAVRSPYVYGSDVSPLVLIKDMYEEKYGKRTPLQIAFWDIENNIAGGEISITSASRRVDEYTIDIVGFIYTGSYPLDIPNIELAVKDAFLDNLPDGISEEVKKSLNIRIKAYSNEADAIIAFWRKMHEWGPDMLSSWSTHDITHHIKRMKHLGLNVEGILTDPELDPSLRYLYTKRDRNQRVTTSGKVTNISFEKQWHLYRTPAKFYLMDNMAGYYFNRRGGKEMVGGYGVDNILNTELEYGKMTFDVVEGLTKEEWHNYMIKYEPVKYFAYNLFDQVGMLFLEDKTTDLSITLPTLAERSVWDTYNLMGRMILDDFHFFAKNNDKVLGSMVVDDDFGEGLGRDDWTVTLAPWMRENTDEKGKLFKEGILPNNIGFGVGDEDVVAAYPNATILAGLSKMTTKREVIDIEGMSTYDLKQWCSSLSSGSISHSGFLVNVCNAPTYVDIYKHVNK